MTNENEQLSPARSDEGVNTAPTLTAADEIAQLRAEVKRLKEQLAPKPVSVGGPSGKIAYREQPFSGARLGGFTKDRDLIRETSSNPDFPKPTTDVGQLEHDFMRWGYCLVEDALNPAQIQAQVDRMLDQAEAERAAGIAHMSHRGTAQLIFNMLPKGQVFRDLIAFEESAIQRGQLIEDIVNKSLGAGFYLGTAHGSIVHQGGGRQELHQDQGFVPLPHPPYPLYCLLIYMYTDFNKDNGATYIVPGSHMDETGQNRVRPDAEYEQMAQENVWALTAPAGTCCLLDSRTLHSGGKRTAPGIRLGARILYARGMMRQQENQQACLPEDLLETFSPKLKRLIGYSAYGGLGMIDGNTINPAKPKVPIGELSMSLPEALKQDFDWRYTKDAKRLSELDWDAHVDYRGPK